MSMTVLVTCNVSPRIRGFLASSMLELGPGVYAAPRLSAAVRDRIWAVLQDWFAAENEASIVMLWADSQVPGGLSVEVLRLPKVNIVEVDGLLLAHRCPGKGPAGVP